MSLTYDDTRFYALLWLKAAEDTVLDVHDAGFVSEAAAQRADALAKPCEKDRPFYAPHESAHERVQEAVLRAKAGQQRHSSWVH